MLLFAPSANLQNEQGTFLSRSLGASAFFKEPSNIHKNNAEVKRKSENRVENVGENEGSEIQNSKGKRKNEGTSWRMEHAAWSMIDEKSTKNRSHLPSFVLHASSLFPFFLFPFAF